MSWPSHATQPSKRQSSGQTTWSASQLVDVTGAHAYQAPTAGQSRGPCPAQNALANHGYLDRSGFTTLLQCTSANVQVYNFSAEFAALLCFIAQFTGGNLLGLTWAIGNDSSVDETIKTACPTVLPLGPLTPLEGGLICGVANPLTDAALGTPGSGLAQTVNSFEGPHSMFQWDWGTKNGLDASTIDINAFRNFYSQALPDGTFDDYAIFSRNHADRWQNSVATNPCFFNAPFAGVVAAPGGHSFAFRMFSNHTPEKPDGTLTKETLASFFSVKVNPDGTLSGKGLGREQIPAKWYRRSKPYTLQYFLAVDYPPLLAAEPRTLSIGGNTAGVNTFTGFDMGDLTGGVYNSKNLLNGDNFACFYYRLLQLSINWELDNAVGGALLTVADTIGGVLNSVFGKLISTGSVSGCPTYANKSLHSYEQYCGVRNKPGALY
ncbi:hypothetical protein MMC16_003515 [Acarospora aff. strigata]|nr:hypothetical protein [Acarospora aff. strigata]